MIGGGEAAASLNFPLWAWLIFLGLVAVLLFFDLFVLHRGAREVPFGEALWLSVGWVVISIAFGASRSSQSKRPKGRPGRASRSCEVTPPEDLEPVHEQLVEAYEEALPAYKGIVGAFESDDVGTLTNAVEERLPEIEQLVVESRTILQELKQAESQESGSRMGDRGPERTEEAPTGARLRGASPLTPGGLGS